MSTSEISYCFALPMKHDNLPQNDLISQLEIILETYVLFDRFSYKKYVFFVWNNKKLIVSN